MKNFKSKRGRGGKFRGFRNHGHKQHKPNNFEHKEKQAYVAPKNNLKEPQVGITEYISDNKGFTAVLKSRFSDFHVNEIDLSGKILQLDDLTVPEAKIETEVLDLTSIKEEFKDIVTNEIWSNIEELMKFNPNNSKESEFPAPIDINVTDLSKDKRTQIHKLVKQTFNNKIISSTVNSPDGEKKFIRISRAKGGKGDNRNRWTWDGEYVHFIVRKENIDTLQAASEIANALKLRPSQVNYAGTKDKRGITTQMFCVKKREPQNIYKSCRHIRNMKIGNFKIKEKVLKLGQLKGNYFKIALRHLNGDQNEIEKGLKNIREFGFINYYGLQRFGNCASIPTYEVGIAILKSDYKLAAELILKPREDDLHFLKNIRETWWKNRNSSEALGMFQFKNNKFVEYRLLEGLAENNESGYSNALRKIPRNMLLLYIHAYQSFIWNRVASRRIKEFGTKIIPGDLVYNENSNVEEILDLVEDDDEDQQSKESYFKQKVRQLTADDISSGKYTIFDVVLPQPGFDITYPANEVGKWYEEYLSENGLSSDKLKNNVKTFSLPGSYRKMVAKPGNMKWEFKSYNSPTDNLIETPFEKAANSDNGQLKALIIDFELPSACYATMFLREILRSDTSASNQSVLEGEEMRKYDDEQSGNMEGTNHSDNEKVEVGEKRRVENDEISEVQPKKIKI